MNTATRIGNTIVVGSGPPPRVQGVTLMARVPPEVLKKYASPKALWRGAPRKDKE